ncbi:hypothetical protein GPX89_12775 [Nocardia sp. ET3-3]|uniref:Neocarzinostatin family protein n=1 Tax=Nocardia terrae TaxID=2675851 RepID=A0A7K1UUW6_9NOCA|nr:neocarzinostatin apoprotein domain-containing protein [Nocardia terrae]MVU78115.1 hypothetical protein [Nocardia terrae]
MRRDILRGVAGAAVTAAALLATAPSATAAPALHPTPAGEVSVGEVITIALDGLPANLPSVAIGQCKPAVTSPSDCQLDRSLLGNADAQGVWQPGQRGRTIVLTASVGGIDCTSAPGACTLAVTSLTNPTAIITSVPLTFGGAPTTQPAAQQSNSSDSHLAEIVTGVVVVVLLAAALAYLLLRVRSRRE